MAGGNPGHFTISSVRMLKTPLYSSMVRGYFNK